MARKRWEARTEITPELLKFREKRKWQIALRRYVVERNPSTFYAPYFGLDIETMRKWFEMQLPKDLGWEDFGKKWQLDHLIPVTCFDFSKEQDLKMCWNFMNLRVSVITDTKEGGSRVDILGARNYFTRLHGITRYPLCEAFLRKLDSLEGQGPSTSAAEAFFSQYKGHIHQIQHYAAAEFELLNGGRTPEEVRKEMDFLKNLSRKPGKTK